ncbi:unnamed protein product [Phytomonas sp. Hart1]|nr:unnamed protein product [Phytomonas sp. Hart1]|eukprot:CCW69616.1 unnamed protein product [Phytomonas sp. isolate Hart1]
MAGIDAFWNPISCTLQLYFSRAQKAQKHTTEASTNAPIIAGSTYTGVSTILYRRDPLPSEATKYLDDGLREPIVLSEYDAFYQHLAHISRANGLHLHACTASRPTQKRFIPLDNLSYQVRCSNSNTPLKILSIIEEEGADGEANEREKETGKGRKACKNPQLFAKKKTLGGNAKNVASDSASPFSLLEAEGSKIIVIEGMPLGVEVELVVRFRGVVQEGDVGAIYSPYTSTSTTINNNNNTARTNLVEQSSASLFRSFPVLTHFEVALARWAFPCPDHPQYRIQWQLRTLQLPSIYHTVVGNTSMGEIASFSSATVEEKGDVRYRGGLCGPFPAYLLAFAAFAGPHTLPMASGRLQIARAEHFCQPPPANCQIEGNSPTTTIIEKDENCADGLELRVIATVESGVPMETLTRVWHVVWEVVRLLQDFFHSPLPLLACDTLTVLLVPMMPYISGMEHHCCVFLNETMFTPKNSGNAKKSGKENHAAEIEQVELIAHEMVHHWMGNAVGLPFAVKEGVCMVLERVFADHVLYGKQKRRVAGLQTGNEATPAATKAGCEALQKGSQPMKIIPDPQKGKEFTGASYQRAQLNVQEAIEICGFAKFRIMLLQMVRQCVLEPLMVDQTYGNMTTAYHTYTTTPSDDTKIVNFQNYWSCEQFLRSIEQADEKKAKPEENGKKN